MDMLCRTRGVWAQIEAIRLPARSRLTPTVPRPSPQPSAEALTAKFKREAFLAASYLSFAAAAVLLFSAPQFLIVAIGLVIAGFVLRSWEVDISSSLRQRFLATESQWEEALENWEKRCGIDKIEVLKRSLVEAKRSLEGLAREETDKLAQYQVDRRERQLKDFLDGFHIGRVKIRGIGPAKQAVLASYGIETAADADQARVLAVPGFGPINSRSLFEWRKQIEGKFNYNAQPNAADQVAIGKIRADVEREAARLRQQLASGAKELWQAVQACERVLQSSDPLLARIQTTRAQIGADFAYLGAPLPPRPALVRKTAPGAPASNPSTDNDLQHSSDDSNNEPRANGPFLP